MKNYFVITDVTNSKAEIVYLDNDNNCTTILEHAKIFHNETEAEEYAEQLGEWAQVMEEEYFFLLENTFLTKLPAGHGHWKITGTANGFSHTIVTSNSQLIDDAFNSEEGDELCYYDSIEEARQSVIDLLNN